MSISSVCVCVFVLTVRQFSSISLDPNAGRWYVYFYLRSTFPFIIFHSIAVRVCLQIDVPKAPGLGLMLNQVVYTRYNEKFGSDGIHRPIDWSKYEVSWVVCPP